MFELDSQIVIYSKTILLGLENFERSIKEHPLHILNIASTRLQNSTTNLVIENKDLNNIFITV